MTGYCDSRRETGADQLACALIVELGIQLGEEPGCLIFAVYQARDVDIEILDGLGQIKRVPALHRHGNFAPGVEIGGPLVRAGSEKHVPAAGSTAKTRLPMSPTHSRTRAPSCMPSDMFCTPTARRGCSPAPMSGLHDRPRVVGRPSASAPSTLLESVSAFELGALHVAAVA